MKLRTHLLFVWGQLLRVTKDDNQLHGLLIVDKPGLMAASGSRSVSGHHADAHDQVSYLADIAQDPLLASPASPTTRLYTSHDIVQLVRRWSKQRRIGHTGTLDPFASGVLVLCLGDATRLVEYYQGHAKQYYAEVTLGSATNTYDCTGVISTKAPIPPLETAQLNRVLERFRGSILQMPPIFSALKQGGESLYRKARRGEQVELEPRPVTFYQLELLSYRPPDQIVLRICCSAGAYIRSLAYDLGLALDTVAHLSRLRREAAGPFTLADAHTLSAIEQASEKGDLPSLLLRAGYGLPFAKLSLDTALLTRLGQGQTITLPQSAADVMHTQVAITSTEPSLPTSPQHKETSLVQAIDQRNQFVGIMRCLGPAPIPNAGFLWKAEKWFATYAEVSQS